MIKTIIEIKFQIHIVGYGYLKIKQKKLRKY